MTRKRYRCPSCSGIFIYDHHPSIAADPLPEDAACPHCHFVAESEYPAAIVSPHIGRPIRAVVDNMNRAMEDGAAFRAQVAQEKLGLDPEEARQLTQTNSLDNLREGDTSYVPVDNIVSRAIDANPQAFGWQGGNAQGAALSPSVQGGPYPNAGLRALQEVRSVHPGLVASTGHRAAVSTTLESTYPAGYKPRV